jgi:hypothetical protein
VVPPAADCFQVRAVARRLDKVLAGGQTAVVTQVLSGLGGVGKTQLAAGLARRVWHEQSVDLVVWVAAVSRDTIVAGYAEAAADVAPGVGDGEQAAARFLAWLASTDRRWLVVLDDLTDPTDLRGLWPPQTVGGRVVVTTRRRDAALAGAGRRLVDVGVFTPGEAAGYLADKLGTDPSRLVQAEQMAADLGFLPLALAQAAAYMLDRGLDCAAYRRRLADGHKTLTQLVPERAALPDDHRAAVAVTWSLSIDLADQLDPVGLARPMLNLASVLDPAGIPLAVLQALAALAYLTRTRAGGGGSVDADAARDALYCLRRLNLIDLDEASASRSVRVHALVQRATREALTRTALDDAVTTAADALILVWPDPERDTELGQALRANTIALRTTGDMLWTVPPRAGRRHELLSRLGFPLRRAHPVLFRAGESLGGAGQVSAAVDYFRELHSTANEYLGPDHLDTLAARYRLAYWQGEAGDPARAAAALEALVDDWLRVLGPDDPGTLAARYQLARRLGEAGDPAGTIAALEALLDDRRRVLGPDHPDTVDTRHELARWRGLAGDPAGAAADYEAVLTDWLRVLGPDNPNTLAARHELANWRGYAGDAVGAVAALEDVVADELRVLGPASPRTLIARHTLASWRGRAGDPAGAAVALEQLLTDRLRILGPDHPDTLDTRHELARWLGESGDPAGTVTALEQLFTDHLRILGPDHPRTLDTRASLAYWQGRARDQTQPD